MSTTLKIFTDGSNNKYHGGRAFVVLKPQELEEIQKIRAMYSTSTDIGYLELIAVAEGVQWAINQGYCVNKRKKIKNILVTTDSQYVEGTWNEHLPKRILEGTTAQLKHMEIWNTLLRYQRFVQIKWTRGHDACPWNKMADHMAKLARTTMRNYDL